MQTGLMHIKEQLVLTTVLFLDNSEIIFPAIGNFLKGELLIPTKTTLRPMAKYISNQAVS